MYAPSVPDATVRTAPVAVWVTLMLAPGTLSPLESRTVPLIYAVEAVCAHKDLELNTPKARTDTSLVVAIVKPGLLI